MWKLSQRNESIMGIYRRILIRTNQHKEYQVNKEALHNYYITSLKLVIFTFDGLKRAWPPSKSLVGFFLNEYDETGIPHL